MAESHTEVTKTPEPSVEHEGAQDIDRRAVLDGMGRFAYAAPALALLARPKAAQADYGGPRRERG